MVQAAEPQLISPGLGVRSIVLVSFKFALNCSFALCCVAATRILRVKGEVCTNPKSLLWPGEKAERVEEWVVSPTA